MNLLSTSIIGLLLHSVTAIKMDAEEKAFNIRNTDFPQTAHFPDASTYKYFVDKSLLIKTFLEDENSKTYVTAPRRFGKTTNLSMLKHFLEIQPKKNGSIAAKTSGTANYKLFANTKLFKEHRTLFDLHFGAYPVIHIDYACHEDITTFRRAFKAIKTTIREAFKQHKKLLLVDSLWSNGTEKSVFQTLCQAGRRITETNMKTAYKLLSDVVYRRYNKKLVVLIDGYDTFLNALLLYDNKEVGKVIALLKAIHGRVSTPSDRVERIFCTGTLHAATNLTLLDTELTHYPFLHHHRYTDYYGITHNELTNLLDAYTSRDDYEIEQHLKDIQDHYGGYIAPGGTSHLYNPFSVIQYLYDMQVGFSKDGPKIYWAQRRHHPHLLNFFYRSDMKAKISELFENKTVELQTKYLKMSTDEFTTLNTLLSANTYRSSKPLVKFLFRTETMSVYNEVYKYLLQHGYLTYSANSSRGFMLRLTNTEIAREFYSMLFETVMNHYNFDYDTMNAVAQAVDDMKQTDSGDELFRKLFNYLHKLFRKSEFYGKTEYDLQICVYFILKDRFKTDITYHPMPVGGIVMSLRNVDGMTILIRGKVEWLSQKKRRYIRLCSEEATCQILDGEYTKERVVYLGICLGVKHPKRGPVYLPTGLGIGYSKSLAAGDDLFNIKTFSDASPMHSSKQLNTSQYGSWSPD